MPGNGGTEPYLCSDVDEQPFKRPSHCTGLIDLWRIRCDVRRQHGTQRCIISHERIHTKLRDRAHELAEKFDVAAERSFGGVGRSNEEMRQPGALNHEDLCVQIGEECSVLFRPVVIR